MENLNETEEKNNGITNEESQNEMSLNTDNLNENLQEEEQNEPDKPKKGKKRKFFWFLFLIVLVAIGVFAFSGLDIFENDDEDDYLLSEYDIEPEGYAVSYKDSKINVINPNTDEIIVEDIDWYCGGISSKDSIVLFAKNGKRGFCNVLTGNVFVEPETYTKAWKFSEGLAAVEKDGFIGFINTNGEVAIDFRFPYRGNSLYEFVFHDGHCIVAGPDNRLGIIDHKGHWVIEPIYDDIDLTKEYAIVYKEGDFKKQIDYNGVVVRDGIIDEIDDIYYNVTYSDLETGCPTTGEIRNPDFYEYRVGDYAGLINSKGQFITQPIYTSITGISKTLFCATLQNYYSKVFIDQNGNVISSKTIQKTGQRK